MDTTKLKPLTEYVRRNWELWCEAAYAKKHLANYSENLWLGIAVPLFIAGFFGSMLSVAAESWIPLACIAGMGIVTAFGLAGYAVYNFRNVDLIPERLSQLRLADVRAASLHELHLYMIELQKKLMDQCRLDTAYKIAGQELQLREHLDRFAAKMETLETSFRDHGDLGAMLEATKIEVVGTKEIVDTQLAQRDAIDRRRAFQEVERTTNTKL